MKLKIFYNETSADFTENVFSEPPRLKEEIEINEPKANAQLNDLKLKKVIPNETGNEVELLNWILQENINLVEKIQLLKDDGSILSEGIIDLEGEIVENNVNHSLKIPIIDILSSLFESINAVFGNVYKTLWEWIEIIHEAFFIPAGIVNLSMPDELTWLTARPIDLQYPGFAWEDRQYKLLYDDLTLKEILKQICILGDCRIFVQNNTLSIIPNSNIDNEIIAPDGELEEVNNKTEILKQGYELTASMKFLANRTNEATIYGIDPTSTSYFSDLTVGSIWEDDNGNQWEFRELNGSQVEEGDDPDITLYFRHYPDPPLDPGYIMPASGYLTHVSGSSDTDDIGYSSTFPKYIENTSNYEQSKEIINDYYKVGQTIKYHNLEGMNSNIKVGDYFTFNTMTMRAVSITRDMTLIEKPLQSVKIKALRKL